MTMQTMMSRVLAREARRLFSSSSVPSPAVTLYQYKICPFCCKTKAIMKYASIPYAAVEVNPLTKAELKALSTSLGEKPTKESPSYLKVPVAVFHSGLGAAPLRVNGSTTIVSSLSSLPEFSSLRSAYLSSSGSTSRSFDDATAQSWLTWCDDSLSVKIYPVLTQSFSSSLRSFSYMDDVKTFTPLSAMTAKYLGAVAMVFGRSRLQKKYGITDPNASLRLEIKHWSEKALLDGKAQFEGGKAPSVADCGVFGVLKGLQGTCDEGQKGNWHEEIVRGDPVVRAWYERMDKLIGGI